MWNNIFFRFIFIKRVWIAIECDIILMISEDLWPIIDRLFMLMIMIMCIIFAEKSRVVALLLNLNIIYWLLEYIIHWLLRQTSILHDHSINGIWDLIKLWHCEMILSDVRLIVFQFSLNFIKYYLTWFFFFNMAAKVRMRKLSFHKLGLLFEYRVRLSTFFLFILIYKHHIDVRIINALI